CRDYRSDADGKTCVCCLWERARKAEARAKELEAALRRYGRHISCDLAFEEACSCGLDEALDPTPTPQRAPVRAGHEWAPHERDGWSVCSRCGMVRNYDRETPCRGSLPKVAQRDADGEEG